MRFSKLGALASALFLFTSPAFADTTLMEFINDSSATIYDIYLDEDFGPGTVPQQSILQDLIPVPVEPGRGSIIVLPSIEGHNECIFDILVELDDAMVSVEDADLCGEDGSGLTITDADLGGMTEDDIENSLIVYNDSSYTLGRIYLGQFDSWSDATLSDLVAVGIASGDSATIEWGKCGLIDAIVDFEGDTVLIEDLDTCGREIAITDDDIELDY